MTDISPQGSHEECANGSLKPNSTEQAPSISHATYS